MRITDKIPKMIIVPFEISKNDDASLHKSFLQHLTLTVPPELTVVDSWQKLKQSLVTTTSPLLSTKNF